MAKCLLSVKWDVFVNQREAPLIQVVNSEDIIVNSVPPEATDFSYHFVIPC